MCGICGKAYFDRGREVERAVLYAMCDTLDRRGPDARGIFTDGPIGLGSTRLSIIDVSAGQMPIANEDETVWIVYNGEVYNYVQLRARLERAGHRFATQTDTETIVHLYEEVGDDFVRHLNGMFALAIWDARRGRLILARDHLGVKPLYYATLQDRIVFGSEIKALLQDGLDRAIDPVALHDYLSLNYVPGPRSIFSGIQKLQPGHMLTFELGTGQVAVRQYWDLPSRQDHTQFRSQCDLESELLELLRQIVRDQMVSDVPIGAFLSGGIDSSLVVALMSEVTSRPVQTFSVGFQEQDYSELPFARMVADRYRTDHTELVLDPNACESVHAMAEVFDEPFADSSSLAVFAVSELARRKVKVALSGDGGDEMFGGYYTYQADKLATIYRRLPRLLAARVIPWLVHRLPISDQKQSLDFKLRRFVAGGRLPPLAAHVSWKAYFSEEMKERLYGAKGMNGHHRTRGAPRPTVHLWQDHFDRFSTSDLMNRFLYVDTKVQLPDDMLTKVDRMSMAHSLEVRVPLLDLRLAEFMAGLPSSLKVKRLQLKYLLKRVAARVLPRAILQRKKAGFHVPIAQWIKSDLREMVHDCLAPGTVARQGLFDPAAVASMIESHERGDCDYGRNIWNLLMFSLWFERYAAKQAFPSAVAV